MDVKQQGLVRPIITSNFPVGSDQYTAVTEQGELLVAPGASPYGEVTKQGRSFSPE